MSSLFHRSPGAPGAAPVLRARSRLRAGLAQPILALPLLALPLLALASLAPLPALAQSATPAPATSEAPRATLGVTGEGVVRAAPDMAQMTLGVGAEAETPGAAVAQLRERLEKVTQVLKQAGIAPRDIQTDQLSLHPRYAERDRSQPGQGPEIVGYEAQSLLRLRVRDLSALGGLIDTAVSSGADRFHGLQFGLANPQEAEDSARAGAMRDAIRRAGILASAAGRELGPILSITEGGPQGGPPMPMMRMEAAQAGGDMPVEGGELETRATVSVIFALGE